MGGILGDIWDAGTGLAGDALGLAGDATKGAFDIGKNTQRVDPFSQSKDYNPNAFQYGGAPGAAQAQANYFQGLAGNAQNRGAAQANYAGANQYANLGLAARGQQQQVANMMMARAQGQVPSIAGMQAQQDMARAQAAQMSAAASARGPAAMALAQQGAANNIANTQGMISGQAQIAAANERLAAENAAMGGYAGLRAGDVASQGQASQQAQYNAGLQQQQHGLNDQYSQAMYGNMMNTNQQQLQAQMGQQTLLANSQLGAQTQMANIGQNNANMDMTQAKMVLGGGQGAADTKTASGLGSDDQMKMGLTPLGNVAPIVSADTSMGPSWKQSAVASNNGALGLAGFSPAQAESIRNPGGAINGWTSDDHAKLQAAFDAGRKFGISNGPPEMAAMSPTERRYQRNEADQQRSYVDEGSGATVHQTSNGEDGRGLMTMATSPVERRYQKNEQDMTSQLAQGLAPYAYEYKPGMGPSGPQVGPRAQLMASTPTTATAITTRPDGLMQIDPAGGTKVALGGVGQLASDIQGIKAYLGMNGGAR